VQSTSDKKNLLPLPEFNSRSFSLLLIHYTHWAILVPMVYCEVIRSSVDRYCSRGNWCVRLRASQTFLLTTTEAVTPTTGETWLQNYKQ